MILPRKLLTTWHHRFLKVLVQIFYKIIELRPWRESGEGEHADLLRDVLPAARRAQLLEALTKPFPHGDYSARGVMVIFDFQLTTFHQIRSTILLVQ